MSGRTLFGEALAYAAAGIPVVPLHTPIPDAPEGAPRCSCGGTSRCKPGKHPHGRLAPHGVKDATTHPAVLRRWWGEYPEANIGLAMGHAIPGMPGYVLAAVDVDPGKGGDRALLDLERCYSQIPSTHRQFTGSLGEHILFAVDEIRAARLRNTRDTNRHEGLDVRVRGGYIVGAPSLHVSGRRYQRKATSGLAAMPPWLVDALAAPSTPPRTATSGKNSPKWTQDDEGTVAQLPSANRHDAAWCWAKAQRDARRTRDEAMRDAPAIHRWLASRPSDHAFPLSEVTECITDVYRVMEKLDPIAAALSHARWPATRLRIMHALIDAARRAGALEFTLSTREIAERASCDHRTVSRNAKALAAENWLSIDEKRGLRGATRWKLLERSADAPRVGTTTTTHNINPLGAPAERDAFEKGGIRRAWPTFLLLAEQDEPISLARLAKIAHPTKPTILEHLCLLERFELASRDPSGSWVATSGDLPRKLTRAADELNTRGRGARRKVRHERERDNVDAIRRQHGRDGNAILVA